MSALRIQRGLPTGTRRQAAVLYWSAFGGKLGRILGPERLGIDFIERWLDPAHAITAVDATGRLLGIAGFKTESGELIGGGLGALTVVYGAFGAIWRAPLLACLERPLEPGVLLMDGIAVAEAARGQGVGTALMAAVADEARSRRMKLIRLDVIDSNPRARALYERLGFEAVGRSETGILAPLLGFKGATVMHRRL
ncbi:MAG: GNAT family N-acetyltransferase [Pseudomonadota bacterium]